MVSKKFLISILILNHLPESIVTTNIEIKPDKKYPTVFVAILVRNKAHILPFFLTLFSRLEYPKSRLKLWIRSDHNEDNSAKILTKWIDANKFSYHRVNLKIDNSSIRLEDEKDVASWPESRYRLLINLREEALQTARNAWADFIWFLDCDVLLTNPRILHNLIEKRKEVVAPMLISNSMYSNFWCGMTSSYYYLRTEEYPKILNKEKTGCFPVPMVHSAVLIDLRSKVADLLTFVPKNIENYEGPIDDIIAFAVGAVKSGISLFVCNDENYGYITVPLNEDERIEDDKNHFTDLKLFIAEDKPALPVDEIFSDFLEFPAATKFDLDEIFVINLKRRNERKLRMDYCFKELGINVSFVEAVDGINLSDEKLNQMGIKLMADYEDPFYRRPMKNGEIGCFLSHYEIWQKVVQNNVKEVLILEDDIRFGKHFRIKLQDLIRVIHRSNIYWDLMYLGRKILDPEKEQFVDNMGNLVYPDYSYWTIGYILKKSGAMKLLDAQPLKNLIPVDEFLPVMYDKHPRNEWKMHFYPRNLVALSVNPLIIFPVKYTNEAGYVSDTENSTIIETNKFDKNEL